MDVAERIGVLARELGSFRDAFRRAAVDGESGQWRPVVVSHLAAHHVVAALYLAFGKRREELPIIGDASAARRLGVLFVGFIQL